MASPSFPPPALVEKVLQLGPGSGPWTRADLTKRWGASSANKFIADAKSAGWMVAPFVNTFYVPPARDLKTVNWLAGIAREEFILSRALAAAGFRCWCLSAWARGLGIETGDAFLVTDLQSAPGGTPPLGAPKAPSPQVLAERNLRLVRDVGTFPLLRNVVMVPFLPQSSRVGEAVFQSLGAGGGESDAAPTWVLDGSRTSSTPAADMKSSDDRRIGYPLTPPLDDNAWIVALVAALEVPRFEESLPALLKREAAREPLGRRVVRVPFADRVRNWGGLFSPPEPNTNWRSVFEQRRTQYLLVPDALWKETAGLSSARRFQEYSRGPAPR